jgi:hypothetical protein
LQKKEKEKGELWNRIREEFSLSLLYVFSIAASNHKPYFSIANSLMLRCRDLENRKIKAADRYSCWNSKSPDRSTSLFDYYEESCFDDQIYS